MDRRGEFHLVFFAWIDTGSFISWISAWIAGNCYLVVFAWIDAGNRFLFFFAWIDAGSFREFSDWIDFCVSLPLLGHLFN